MYKTYIIVWNKLYTYSIYIVFQTLRVATTKIRKNKIKMDIV